MTPTPPPTPEEPIPPTIPDALARAAARFPTGQAVAADGVSWTFAELDARVGRAARALSASGVEPGERVAIWAPNRPEWIVASLAVYHSGAALVPLNTRLKGAEAAYILGRARVRRLFTVTGFLGIDYVGQLESAGAAEGLDEIVILGGDDSARTAGTVAWDTFLARADSPDAHEPDDATSAGNVAPDDISDVLFTSGTTGRPKGAMLRHGASTKAFSVWADLCQLREGDRYLVVNPFFHSFGLKAGILACLLRGATILPQAVLDVDVVLERIAAEGVSVLPGPPTLYQTLLEHPRLATSDHSSLRVAVTGAASVPVELVRRMRDELHFERVLTAYGLTESTGIATMCRAEDPPETVAHTSGRAIPGVEVAVVDEDGGQRPAGEPGEVVVRGYTLMAGYLDDPEATAAAIDGDGWLHTGDVGVLDDDGNLRITDRLKDMFIVGGFNVYPAEVEAAMLRHPAVSQVAVVGVPDERMGEVGTAFVVARRGAGVDPDALIAWCRGEMANYKVPRHVTLVDTLPLNASGKVLKYQLRHRDAIGANPRPGRLRDAGGR